MAGIPVAILVVASFSRILVSMFAMLDVLYFSNINCSDVLFTYNND